MRWEVYPEKMGVVEKRKNRINLLINSTWKIKLKLIILLLAVVINAALIISIITEGESFYYRIFSWDTGFGSRIIALMPNIGNEIPVYAYTYDYKTSFHIYFWLMTIAFLICSTGFSMKNKEDNEKWIKIFYSIYSINIVIGLIKIVSLFVLMEYNNLILAVRLAVYLTFYPFMLVIPIQFLSLKNKVCIIDWIKGNNLNKKISLINGIIRGVLLFTYVLILGLSYLGIEYII